MKSSDTLLILDLGSSSVRALLFDGNAQLITGGMARREHRFVTSAPGESSADADALRLLAEACIAEVLQHPAARDLRAMGMATFVGNVLGVGRMPPACAPNGMPRLSTPAPAARCTAPTCPLA